jgi:hypothetical protein
MPTGSSYLLALVDRSCKFHSGWAVLQELHSAAGEALVHLAKGTGERLQ